MLKKISHAALLILLSVNLLSGQKTFENKKFGFSMKTPENWIVTTNTEVLKNIEKVDLTEESLAKIFKNEKQVIFLTAFIKYKTEEHSGLIPKIQISVLPQNTKSFTQFKTAISNSAKNMKNFFQGYEIVQEPEEIEISGVKSVVFVGHFTLKMQNGAELKTRSRVLAIPYKNYFFQVSFVDGQNEEDNFNLYNDLMKTIKIGN